MVVSGGEGEHDGLQGPGRHFSVHGVTRPHPGPPRSHLLPPDRKGHRRVEILSSIKHWLPVPKDLCFKVLDHVLHYFPGMREESEQNVSGGRDGTRGHVLPRQMPGNLRRLVALFSKVTSNLLLPRTKSEPLVGVWVCVHLSTRTLEPRVTLRGVPLGADAVSPNTLIVPPSTRLQR